MYSLAAVVLLVRYTKQSEYLGVHREGRSPASSRSTRATSRAAVGREGRLRQLEGEEPVEAADRVVRTQATQQKEEEDGGADDRSSQGGARWAIGTRL